LNSPLEKIIIFANSSNQKKISIFLDDLKNCSGAKSISFQNVDNEDIDIKII